MIDSDNFLFIVIVVKIVGLNHATIIPILYLFVNVIFVQDDCDKLLLFGN